LTIAFCVTINLFVGNVKPPVQRYNVGAEKSLHRGPSSLSYRSNISPDNPALPCLNLGKFVTCAKTILVNDTGIGKSLAMTFMSHLPGTNEVGIPGRVSFHRTELGIILSLYGRMVAAGEWRDYGISMLKDVAIFSIYRRTAETPLYRIEKNPKLANRQGMYSVIGMDGRILRRGHDLRTVLRVLERKLIRAI
jgi:Protein of unknown function (DUF2794)